MNIDSLSSHPLLSSSESNDNIQNSLQSDGLDAIDFSATLLEKVRQLEGMEGNSLLLENFNLNKIKNLQDVAGVLGNFLPVGKKMGNEFDLDNVLQEIADVADFLKNIEINGVEVSKHEGSELEIKLSTLLEDLETIKTIPPEQAELNEKFEQLDEEVKKLQKFVSTLVIQEESPRSYTDKVELNNELSAELSPEVEDNQLDQHDLEKLDLEQSLNSAHLVKQDSLDNKRIDKSTSNLGNTSQDNRLIDNSIDMERQIDHLAHEIQAIKETISEKMPDKNNLKKEFRQSEISHKEVTGLQKANQPAAIVNILDETKKIETVAMTTSMQEIKADYKKEYLPLKKVIDGGAITSQQENTFSKPGQEKPIVVNNLSTTKENLSLEEIDPKGVDLRNEKVLSRFVTDLAVLNRTVTTDNKVDLPPMTKHFSHPEWNKEIGERVVWMHKQTIPSAELKLNPEHLGPIRIKIDVTQEQATIAFTAQHANVKEAIEASIPKLRELFSAQQLNLTDVNVSQNDSGQKQAREFEQMDNGTGNNKQQNADESVTGEQAENSMEIVDEIEAGRAIASNGVLSIFA